MFRRGAASARGRHEPPHHDSGKPAASTETRCDHCFITFATPAELMHHATHHCFPDDPAEVLRRFPVGVEVLDTVSQEQVVVVGAASNKRKAHSSVAARDLRRGLVADVPISRLRKRSLGTLSTRSALRFCSGQPQPSYPTEPLIRIPSAEVSAVARSIAEDGAARYIGLCLSFAKFLSKFGWARLSAEILRNLGGPARKNERGVLSRKFCVSPADITEVAAAP